MKEFIQKILTGLFPVELQAAEKIGHDPLAGHCEDSRNDGKSYFHSYGNSEYLDYEGGPCNADDGMPWDAAAELVETVRDDDSVKLFVYRLVPTKMVVEGLGGRCGGSREPTEAEKARGVDCGSVITTGRINGDIVVEEVHGCLQLCGNVAETKEETTTEFTVAITHEPDGQWVLAAAYPGRPGGGIGEYLSNVMHYKHHFDKEDGVPPVKGFEAGDTFEEELLVEEPPAWIYDHIVDMKTLHN